MWHRANPFLFCAAVSLSVVGPDDNTFLGKHCYVKPTKDHHIDFLCIVKVSYVCLLVDQVLHFSKHLQKEGEPRAFVQLHYSCSFCRQLWLMLSAGILHHKLHFDVALAQGCSPPAMHPAKPQSEVLSPGRVRVDSTAFVLLPLPPLQFSLPVAIIAHQHRLTIAQANPWNKWIQGQGPILVELCHWL